MSSFGFSAGSLYPNVRAVFKHMAHQHPILLGAARGVRSFFRKTPKPPKLLPGYAPLCVDEAMLNEIGQISPTAKELILTEFAEISRALQGVDTGFSDSAEAILQRPLDDLFASSAELNLAFTPGKVGSCTAASTLEKHASFKPPIPVVHFLSSKGHAYVEKASEQCRRWPESIGNWREGVLWSRMLRLPILLNQTLRAAGGPLAASMQPLVISGVRERGDSSFLLLLWLVEIRRYAGRPHRESCPRDDDA